MSAQVMEDSAVAFTHRGKNRSWAKFRRNRSAMLGAAIVLFFLLAAIFAPFVAVYDPVQVAFSSIRKAPSAVHWFGTDELGRDIFSRMVYGARASL
ncbi:MAG TPA: ABC transporter permease, partial [Paralcaligenes sp.]